MTAATISQPVTTYRWKTATMIAHLDVGVIEIVCPASGANARDWKRLCRQLERLDATIAEDALYSPLRRTDTFTAVCGSIGR